MPARYEGIRDSLVKKGMPLKKAKTQAAKTYNATRKKGEVPVTGNYEASLRRKVKRGLKRAFPK